ncbi:MAG: sarcosine oxidase subunit gamma [Rhizobiales bacterium]|nr:sarcosine oxidase subunit gamma [Hyphomicrobiales bacterium]MBI3674359.1 sarcosine oxidase subunit gamma [Hyphomicrobiales bacterium]
MSELHVESPLSHVAAPQGLAIGLREMTGRGMIDLRGGAGDAAFMAAAKDVLGAALPTQPRTSVSWGDIKALWLSIDQWLILCPGGRTAELLAALRTALAGIHSLAVDVSDMRAVIRLEGEGSREILMKGSSLDLIDGSYGPGAVRRMRFAEIAALLHVVDDNIFDVYVFRSYADYAWEFLLATAREPAKIRLFGRQAAPV